MPVTPRMPRKRSGGAPRSGSLLAVRAGTHSLVAPAGHVLDEVAGAKVRRPCSRPPRRSRRLPSARRAGTAGHSFSRRSSGRACRDRPTARGCGRGPCRRRAAASSTSFSSKLSAVGMPLGRLLRCQARAIVVLLSAPPHRRSGEHKKDPAVKGTHRRVWVSLRWRGGSAPTALAVGALEAAIEDPRAHFALVLALEQGAAAALVAPALRACSAEQSRITRSPSTRSMSEQLSEWCTPPLSGSDLVRMMRSPATLSTVPTCCVVAADDFHMLADLAEHAALLHAAARASCRNRFRTATDARGDSRHSRGRGRSCGGRASRGSAGLSRERRSSRPARLVRRYRRGHAAARRDGHRHRRAPVRTIRPRP